MAATEQLIEQLASGVRPTSPTAALQRLLLGIAGGASVSLLLVILMFGRPAALVEYTGIPAFAMKLSFSAAMMAAAAVLLYIAGRPGHRIGKRLVWLAVPPALIAVTAVMELSATAPQFRDDVWLGSTWQTCLAGISLMSLPVLGGIVWAFRRFAPTRLRLAGLLAGITSGATAAVLYALYCPETTASFLVSWYSLGIAAAGLIGWIAGPRLLKW